MTYPTILWLFLLNLLAGILPDRIVDFIGPVGLSWSILGGICCFTVSMIPYVVAQGGAGDVKLATVIGAGMGVSDGLLTVCIAFVLSAMLGIAGAIWTRGLFFVVKTIFKRLLSFLLPIFYSTDQEEKRLLKEPIPLAPGFCLATLGMLSGSMQNILGIPI